MDTTWPENLLTERKKAVDELLRGRDFAKQLKIVLHKSLVDDGSVSAEDLVLKILSSFTNTISILDRVESEEVSQLPASTHAGSPRWDGRMSEDSEESAKSFTPKDRRGCYKRRRNSYSWSTNNTTLIDDGHAWRKYGQKVILNAKYPRNYFRCTHKFDRGCQATKQVQRIEDDPAMFRTTYYGHHTCNNLLKASQLILDTAESDSSVFLSFNSRDYDADNLRNKQDHHSTLFTSFPSIKQESDYNRLSDDMPLNDHMTHHNLSTYSSSDYLLPTFDHGDVISGITSSTCTNSTCSFDHMGFMAGFGDDALGFEF